MVARYLKLPLPIHADNCAAVPIPIQCRLQAADEACSKAQLALKPTEEKNKTLAMSLSTAEELLEQHTLALRSLASDLGAATAASAAELGPRELATGGQRQLCHPPQSDSLCYSCQLEGALIGWYCSRSCPVREGTKHPHQCPPLARGRTLL